MQVKRAKKVLIGAIMTIVVSVFLIIEIYPLIWTILSSFKKQPEFFKAAWSLPEKLYFGNFQKAWVDAKLNIYMVNTAIVSVSSMFLVFFLSSTSAFALCKMRFRYSNAVTIIFLMGLLIPVFVMLIPELLLFNSLGISNTLWAMVVHFSAGISLPMYLMLSYYKYIPNEMIEASVIDGCSIYGVYARIILPLSKNVFITVILITFSGVWNEFIAAKTFVTDPDMTLLQVGLLSFGGALGARQWGPTFAGVVISILPMIVLYMFLSKQIMSGLTAGAVKG